MIFGILKKLKNQKWMSGRKNIDGITLISFHIMGMREKQNELIY